ncbi:hypothetical protein DES34_1291, partial [Brevibacillus brevis]
YASLLDEITKDYPGSDYLDHASNGAPLGTIAIQYQETDWQFLKRLASRFGSILVAEAVADTPKFWFGLPEGRTAQLTDASYTISKRLSPYMETTENGYAAGMSENDFLTYEVESGQVLQLGDRVNYQGKELVVAGSTTRIDHALLIHTYQLMPEAGIRQNPIRNDDICGAALEGKIIDIQKDTVKIHLDIDPKQPKAEASWFPYATVYSAEGNSGFHCMPQMGDSVKLYFSTPDEEGAMAVSSVRKGGGSTAKTGNPGIKYWGTNFGKELMMGGKELVLTAKESKEGNIFIKLHEEDGIEIHSMHPIVFTSEKDMEITSDTKVEIKAKEAIYLMCSTSSMILDGEVDLQAPKIEMVGLTKAPVVVEDLPQEEEEVVEEEQQEEEESGWGGFLDGVQLALDVVGLIPGLGEVADLANAGISLARGDYAGAALSLAACIPFAGWAATGAKLGAKAHKALKGTKAGQKVLEVADSAADVVKNVANAVESTVGKVWTAARKTLDEMDVVQAVQRIKEQLHASVMAAKDAVISKATQMKEQLKQKARKLRDDMQEGLQNLADSLGPQLQSAEGFPIKFSNKKDVVELPRTENQRKWDETFGRPNEPRPNQKPPEKPPEGEKPPETEGTGKPNLSSGDLGELLGSGGNKNVYAYGEDKAVGVLKDGKPQKLITEELGLLNKLDELGLPTVNGRSIFVDGKDALMFDRFAQGSKDIVKLHDGKVQIVGESSLLNQRSIEDLTAIRKIMVEKKIKINDLQFLIGKDGRVVVADPLNVEVGKKVKPSKNNLRMIDLLIESARKNSK